MNRSTGVQEPYAVSADEMPELDVVNVVVPNRIIQVLDFEGDVQNLRKRAPHVVVDVLPGDAA